MIKNIDHIGILTSDLEKSVKFYTGVLGFSIAMKMEMAEAGLSAVFVEKAGSKIELMEYRGKNAPRRSKGVEISIGVHSIPINDHTPFLWTILSTR
jgi:catechol 2,3-dioxygenase-like lactoylglutathione lyase family enzyme